MHYIYLAAHYCFLHQQQHTFFDERLTETRTALHIRDSQGHSGVTMVADDVGWLYDAHLNMTDMMQFKSSISRQEGVHFFNLYLGDELETSICIFCTDEPDGDGERWVKVHCERRHIFHRDCFVLWSRTCSFDGCPLCCYELYPLYLEPARIQPLQNKRLLGSKRKSTS